VGVVCWRSTGDLRLRFSTLLVTTALVSPHTYTYDMVILLPAGFLLWDYAVDADAAGDDRRSAWIRCLVLAGYAAPVLGYLALVLHVQLSVPLLFAAALLATSISRTEQIRYAVHRD
jgi:hypothetical protein